MFWKPICVILNRASFTWLLYCLTKVELTSAWSSVAMMFVLISGYLGIWMDMICVAFWKITVVLCSHMSLQRQEYLVFLMAQRKKWKTQHSCGKLLTSTWLPEGMKLFQQLRSHNPDETMRISVWSTCLKVWQCTLWYYVSKLLRHPFSIFRSVPFLCNEFKMSSLVPHHPFYFLSTELVQTNWRASSVPTTHEFLDSDIMPRDLRAWREQRKQKQLEGEQVLYLMNQDMVASTEGGIQMNLKIRPNRNICIQYYGINGTVFMTIL